MNGFIAADVLQNIAEKRGCIIDINHTKRSQKVFFKFKDQLFFYQTYMNDNIVISIY